MRFELTPPPMRRVVAFDPAKRCTVSDPVPRGGSFRDPSPDGTADAGAARAG